jgi:hypothetical protein
MAKRLASARKAPKSQLGGLSRLSPMLAATAVVGGNPDLARAKHPRDDTIVHVLLRHFERTPDKIAFRFLATGDLETSI